jgi:hypothetical protein
MEKDRAIKQNEANKYIGENKNGCYQEVHIFRSSGLNKSNHITTLSKILSTVEDNPVQATVELVIKHALTTPLGVSIN